jgi:antitoxin component YwqK of YwqJK toxin-antitoxin module
VKDNALTQAEADEVLTSIDDIRQVAEKYRNKYAPFGAWSDAKVVENKDGKPAFSVIRKNGEYTMNLDFSTVCKKRRTLDAVFSTMIDRGLMETLPMDGEQIAEINNIIRKHGFETACALCFVDAKRFRVAQVADKFCEMWNTMARMNDRQLKATVKAEKNKSVRQKVAMYLLENPEERVELKRENLIDSKGFEDITINKPEVLSFYKQAQGTSLAKIPYGDVQYMNDIENSNWTPDRAYAVGGVRLQSFSDYVPRMFFDYMQMMAGLAAKQMPVHAYTKEPIFAKQFGLTGMKINLSLVPKVVDGGVAAGLDADGNYAWMEGETFPYDEAIALQNAEGYRENCGTIAVGVSDEHISKMLDDPNIRMVIPYHKSGLNPLVAKKNRISEFADYTNVQNTRSADGGKLGAKALKDMPNFNALMHEGMDARQAAQAYLDWCDENGFLPKFDKFRNHPNYYKLLEDFTTIVPDANGVETIYPQGAVSMTFPTEEDAFGSIESLIREGLEEDAILEGRRDENVEKIVDAIEEELGEANAQFRIADNNEQTQILNAKQKNINQPEVVTQSDIMFRITKNNRTTINGWLDKRDDLSTAEKESFLNYLDEGEYDNKTQLATGKWFANGVIRLPEDMPKVEQAMKVATIAKVDPLQYKSPMELIDRHADIKLKEKPIDPDTVDTLYDRHVVGDTGIVTYEVEESEESRENMRKIINTHFGDEASPWCLLQGDGKGNLTPKSAEYWEYYSAYPKRVAFKDGKLLAFSANSEDEVVWWDRQDEAHEGIPVVDKIDDDELGRSASFIYDDKGNVVEMSDIHRGNKVNGVHEVWSDLDTLEYRETLKNGLRDGLFERWNEDGVLVLRAEYKDSHLDGKHEQWYDNGQIKSIGTAKKGLWQGKSEYYFPNGNLSVVSNLSEGLLDGVYEEYWDNGQIRYRKHFKVGKHPQYGFAQSNMDGVYEEWSVSGNLKLRHLYKDGVFVKDLLEEEVESAPQFRISDYDRQFADLQSEYDALDKNDEKALNEWREKKKGVTLSYMKATADDLNYPIKDFRVIASEEDMRNFYEEVVKFFNEEMDYKKFAQMIMKPAAFYLKDMEIIGCHTDQFPNVERKAYVALFHEQTHCVNGRLFSDEQLANIWDEAVQNAKKEKTERIARNYGDNPSNNGDEYLAYTAQRYAHHNIREDFESYIKGEDGVSLDTFMRSANKSLPLRNQALIEILKYYRNGYNKRRHSRNVEESHNGLRSGNGENQRDIRAERGGIRGGVLDSLLNDVAQRGLREMVGEDAYNAFLMRAVRDLDESTRRAIMENGMRNGLNFHDAAEEYLASLAEQDNVDEAYLSKVNALVKGMLQNAGIEVGDISNNELRYMLWRSHLQYDGIFSLAEDVVMRNRLGVGNYTQEADVRPRYTDSEAKETSFRIREQEPPKNTGIGYKVFVLKDGKLYPPMVANPDGAETPVGVWLDADTAPISGTSKTGRSQVKAGGKGTQGGSGSLAYRPGWHLGSIPYALQFNRKNPDTGEHELFPNNFVWAEVDYANDVDYQEEAMSYGYNKNGKFQHSYAGLPRVPENGAYIYRTNPNPKTDPWVITGAMKVNRLLTPSEVDEMVIAAGRTPQLRQEGAVTDADVGQFNEENGLTDTSFRVTEREQIIEDAKADGTYLKAPNGKDTNLTPEQWVTVRTDAFKKWFGDWENDPANASQIVDANGEPKVVYHRTPNEFTIFNTEKIGSSTDWGAFGMGFYFSPNSDRYDLYGKNEMALFLNARNPLMLDNSNAYDVKEPFFKDGSWNKKASEDFTKWVKDNGYDAVVYKSAFDEEDIAFSPNQIKSAEGNTTFDANNDDIRFRVAPSTPSTTIVKGEAKGVRESFDDMVKRASYQMKEAGYDRYQSIKEFMRMASKAHGVNLKNGDVKEIVSYENPYIALLNKSSINEKEVKAWEKKYYIPIIDAIQRIYKDGKGKIAQLQQHFGSESMDDILNNYLQGKHGLERNRDMAVKASLEKMAEETMLSREMAEKYLEKIAELESLGEMTPAEAELQRRRINDQINTKKYTKEQVKYQTEVWEQRKKAIKEDKTLDTWRKKQEALDKAAITEFGVDLAERDYSGLGEVFPNKGGKLQESIEAAYKAVVAFEEAFDTADLWKAIKAANDATLEKAFMSSIINRETYNNIRNMYDYYIPLRGFEADTTEDVYGYLNNEPKAFSMPVKRANGRASKAEFAIPHILQMAHSAILQGNNNLAKLTMANFVQHYPSDLVKQSNMWIEYDETSKTWVAKYPDIPKDASVEDVSRIVDDFNANMEELAKDNPKKYRKVKGKMDVPYIVPKDKVHYHQIPYKRNGVDYILTVSGSPRLAFVMNGEIDKAPSVMGEVGEKVEGITRFLSGMYTQYNPDFMVSNFFRDGSFVLSTVPVREDAKYAANYYKNYFLNNPLVMTRLFNKYEAGTLNRDNYIEAAFEDFLKHGGETGYAILRDVEETKKKVKKDIHYGLWNKAKALIDRLGIVGRGVESSARFAAYLTSREAGRSIARSVYDAKEVSVNFNRKGAGAVFNNLADQNFWGKMVGNTAGVFKITHAFFNAGVQGLAGVSKLVKHNPVKGGMWLASPFLLGVLIASLYDDDDEYYNLTETVRRQNIMIRMGDDYVSIPLAIELRALYGIGEMMVSLSRGKEDLTQKDVAYKIAEQILQAFPINVLEGNGGFDALMPTAYAMVQELMVNEDWQGIPIYREDKYAGEEYKPEWRMVNNYTDERLVAASKFLSKAAGGDYGKRGRFVIPILGNVAEINPAVVQHIMEGMFGGPVTFANKVLAQYDVLVGDKEFEWRNVPFLNRLVKDGGGKAQERMLNREYRNNEERYEQMHSQEVDYQKFIKDASNSEEERAEYQRKLDELRASEEYEMLNRFHQQSLEIDKMYKAYKDQGILDEQMPTILERKEIANAPLR